MIFGLRLSIAFLGIAATVAAQDSAAAGKLRLASLQVNFDYMNLIDAAGNPYRVITLAPGMPMLSKDKTGFQQFSNTANAPERKALDIRAELNRRPPRKTGRLRSYYVFGLGYETRKVYCLSYRKNEVKNFDLIQAANGDRVYLDSIIKEQYDFAWFTRNISTRFGQLFRFGERKPSNVYFGYLFETAFSLQSRVDGRYERTILKTATTEQWPDPDLVSSGYEPSVEIWRIQQQAAAAAVIGRMVIPIGVDLHGSLGKMKDEFGMSYEIRPGLETIKAPGLSFDSRFFIGFHFGIKYFFCRADKMAPEIKEQN